MANIRLIYNKYKRIRDGKAPVYVEVSFNRGKRKTINSKILLSPEQWNDKNKTIKSNYPLHLRANKYLLDSVTRIKEYELKLIDKGYELTPELLDTFLSLKTSTKGTNYDFYEFALKELDKEKLAIGTYNSKRSKLRRLQKHSPSLSFDQLTYEYIKLVDDWLNHQSQITSQNTIATYHKVIKKYINLAINLGYIKSENNPYNNFKVKKTPTTRTNLNENEVKQLENVVLTNNYLERIRDMFLFSCYTGLRYSDITKLTQSTIQIYDNGEVYIRLSKMQKTDRPVTLPLHLLFGGKPIEIFNRYYNKDSRYLFGDIITNQYINRELKFIARTSGIFYKEITFHMARHTFGSMLAEKTGDPYLIKDLMGHSDIKMSMQYIHGSDRGRELKLKNVEW